MCALVQRRRNCSSAALGSPTRPFNPAPIQAFGPEPHTDRLAARLHSIHKDKLQDEAPASYKYIVLHSKCLKGEDVSNFGPRVLESHSRVRKQKVGNSRLIQTSCNFEDCGGGGGVEYKGNLPLATEDNKEV